MPKYVYKAKTEEGEKISGQMQAMDENDLHLKLRQENKYLISAKRAEEVQRIHKIKAKYLSEFCRQIGTLSASGVSLVRALNIIAQDESNKKNEKQLTRIFFVRSARERLFPRQWRIRMKLFRSF